MTARDELLRITVFGAASAELAEQRIDAYRAEVLREAAQRAESHANGAHSNCGPCSIAEVIADELRWMVSDTP